MHVCSEECGRRVSLQPDSREDRDSGFQKVYAVVFLTVLLAVLGGGLCVWRAQWTITMQKDELQREKMGWHVEHKHSSPFNVFYDLGITDWRVQFGIGAAAGAGSALAFMAKFYLRAKKSST